MAASYVRLWKTGELVKRAEEAVRRLARCDLCPRHCHVDRLGGEVGQCRTGRLAAVSSYGPH
ncbi:MAG: radical SAM protein, partial [Chloroflexota bacterium]